MAKLPAPPAADELRARAPVEDDLLLMAAGTVVWRIQRTRGDDVVAADALRGWGLVASCRFDPQPLPPGPSEEGVRYAAAAVETALAETYQAGRLIDRHIGAPYLVALALARDLALLGTGGPWPTRAGASQALNSGRRDTARARAVRGAFPDLAGSPTRAPWPAAHAASASGTPRRMPCRRCRGRVLVAGIDQLHSS